MTITKKLTQYLKIILLISDDILENFETSSLSKNCHP